MSPFVRPRPVSPLVRLLRLMKRAFVFALRVLIVGLSMGIAPPSLVEKVLKHEDPTVQVEEDREKAP
jgi:hypothetical protein